VAVEYPTNQGSLLRLSNLQGHLRFQLELESRVLAEPPTPKGGFRAIQKALKYPEIARKAGIEGRVTVHVLVSEKGIVIRTKILQSLGHTGCDQAAVNAIKKVRWNPAMQRDKPVKVWVAIPVIFRLK